MACDCRFNQPSILWDEGECSLSRMICVSRDRRGVICGKYEAPDDTAFAVEMDGAIAAHNRRQDDLLAGFEE